jgi:hypothetical protein
MIDKKEDFAMLSKDSKSFTLNENITIPATIPRLKRWCRKNRIKIRRVPMTIPQDYSLKLDDLWGTGRAEVTVHHIFGKITTLDIFNPLILNTRISLKNVYDHYEEINEALISQYGSPDEITGSMEDDDIRFIWHINGVRLCHYLFERFGVGEYLRVTFMDKK